MSRVVKAGRLFKPVAKTNTASTKIPEPITTQLPTPPSTSTATDYPPSINHQSPSATRPLFQPETSPPLQQHAPTASSSSTPLESVGVSQLSAAEKMKLKAKAAKAARAVEKLRNPSAFRRSTSVLTDTSTLSIHKNPSIQANSPPPTTTQASLELTEDISVPDPNSTTTQKAWSPPIDPLLDIAAFVDHTAPPLLDHHFSRQDILVPPSHQPLPSPTFSGPSPTLPNQQSQVTDTHEQQPAGLANQTKPSKPPTKKQRANVTRDESNDPHDEDEEDISPRLKRKRHLEQLRKSKKNQNNAEREGIQTSNQNQDNNDQMDKVNQKVTARFKRRLENNSTGSQVKTPRRTQNQQHKQTKKKNKGLDGAGEGVDENAGPEAEEEGSSDGALDPTKVAMAELTRPELAKGQSSEVLEKRLALIIERREREKNERMVARQEAKQQARLLLFNRGQSVKARRKAKEEEEELSQQLGPIDHDDQALQSPPDLQLDQEQQEQQQEADALEQEQIQSENRKRKIMEEYGLENLDSDDDLVDFEEVEYDQFASSSKKKPPAAVGSHSQPSTTSTTNKANKSSATATGEGDEDDDDEDLVIEDFNMDDYVPQASQFAPQLRVVDGQMILDQDSLAVDRRDHTPELDDMEVVEESDATRLVNSNTWSKGVRGERWTADETSLFYDAVRLFGSDFEMISQLFPGRTRRQIRLKWNKEEKRNGSEITAALLGKRGRRSEGEDGLSRISEHQEGEDEETVEIEEIEEVDDLVIPSQLNGFTEYARIVGIDCSGPIPIDPMDKWREKERLEHEEARLLESSSSISKAKKNDHVQHPLNDDDEDEGELVEEDFGGWGELDDL